MSRNDSFIRRPATDKAIKPASSSAGRFFSTPLAAGRLNPSQGDVHAPDLKVTPTSGCDSRGVHGGSPACGIIKGGQGRDECEVEGGASVIVWCVAAALFWTLGLCAYRLLSS